MPRCCITRYFIESLKSEKSINVLSHYYDEEIPGFMLEYRGNGRGTWYFRYYTSIKRTRYYRIGALQLMSVFEARSHAYTLYKLVRDGIDIKSDKNVLQDSVCFGDFVNKHYVPHIRLKKRSWELDQRILRIHILPYFAHFRMDKVRRTDVMTWQSGLRNKGLAAGTCNRIFVLLKTVFNCAIRWGYLLSEKNPCRDVSPFADTSLKERYLTSEEARQIVGALHTSHHQQSSQAILLLLYTGARKSEILSARWEHVDLERCLLTVPLSKSGKTRHIPLSDDAVKIFRGIQRCEHEAWVFPGSGHTGHLQSVFRHWDSLRKRLGLSDVRLHDLRHSFASFLVNAGCSLYEVQRCLGHYDPKVTMRYAHLAPQVLVKAANMVGESLRRESSMY